MFLYNFFYDLLVKKYFRIVIILVTIQWSCQNSIITILLKLKTKRWYQRLLNFLFLIPKYFKDYFILSLEISLPLRKQVYPKKMKGYHFLSNFYFL